MRLKENCKTNEIRSFSYSRQKCDKSFFFSTVNRFIGQAAAVTGEKKRRRYTIWIRFHDRCGVLAYLFITRFAWQTYLYNPTTFLSLRVFLISKYDDDYYTKKEPIARITLKNFPFPFCVRSITITLRVSYSFCAIKLWLIVKFRLEKTPTGTVLMLKETICK